MEKKHEDGKKNSANYWVIDEAMERLGLSDRSIRRLIHKGELTGRKVAGKWWVLCDHLLEAYQQNLTPPPKEAPATTKMPPLPAASPAQEGRELVGAPLEPLESLIEMKRIGAWRKVSALYPLLTSEDSRSHGLNAAAYLVEGFLAIGSRKTDAYMRSRAALCRLLVELQFVSPDEKIIRSCYDALSAVQHLIIRFSGAKPRSKGPGNAGASI